MSEPVEIFTTHLPRVAAGVVDPGRSGSAPSLVLRLTHEQRRRARLRVVLPDGSVVGLALPRGLCLKDGDWLQASATGKLARVQAAPEHVSVARTADPLLLARAAYHLGNRHVALAIRTGALTYLRDHVLDGMCRELGLDVEEALAPFEPEAGGYGHAHGAHSHTHTLLRTSTQSRHVNSELEKTDLDKKELGNSGRVETGLTQTEPTPPESRHTEPHGS